MNCTTPETTHPRALVILCAGDTSLHEANLWHRRDLRDFDLCIVYFGANGQVEARYKTQADFFVNTQGPKWRNVWNLVTKFDFWKLYDFVWLPDDDLEIPIDKVNQMFHIVYRDNIALSQPSLYPENATYAVLVHDPRDVRETKPVPFVEIQMPCIRADIFVQTVVPMLTEHHWNLSGWGFDVYWSAHTGDKRLINAVVARHTKPVQTNGGFYKAYGINPNNDLADFLWMTGLRFPIF